MIRLARSLPVPPVPVLLALVFAAILALAMLATSPLRDTERRNRLAQIERFRPRRRGTGATTSPGEPAQGLVTQSLLDLADRVARSRGWAERIGNDLEQAGILMLPAEWLVLRASATLTGLVTGWYGLGPGGAAAGALAGWALVGGYRRLCRKRRVKAFSEQLPDALQLVVSSLRSGFSLAQAIAAVVQDAPPGPLATEFGRAVAETRVGVELGTALERAALRTRNSDLSWAVMAIQIQRESGGNLAKILETTVVTIRERDRLRRQVRALSAEGRLSADILVCLPIWVALWMFLVRREYLSPLWSTPLGVVMSVGSIVLVALGWFWMSRWSRAEV